MGTTAEKLAHTLACKESIKAAIQEKGVSIDDATKFADYAGKIESIETGIDTSNTTATAADIRSGKTAASKGKILTGTMTDEFYVCISADDATKTWSGRRLELNADGYYEATGSIVNNIPYLGFVPVAGCYYDKKTLVKIEKLYSPSSYLEGIVFAASMQDNTALYNGNTITLDGVNIVTAPGYTDGTKVLASGFEFALDGEKDFADGNSSFAMSVYLNPSGSDSQYFLQTFLSNGGSGAVSVHQQSSNGSLMKRLNLSHCYKQYTADFDAYGWYHVVMINKGTEYAKHYINGVEVSSKSGVDLSYLQTIVRISAILSGSYMKDLQIYNRALEAAEVEDLYASAKLPTA